MEKVEREDGNNGSMKFRFPNPVFTKLSTNFSQYSERIAEIIKSGRQFRCQSPSDGQSVQKLSEKSQVTPLCIYLIWVEFNLVIVFLPSAPTPLSSSWTNLLDVIHDWEVAQLTTHARLKCRKR